MVTFDVLIPCALAASMYVLATLSRTTISLGIVDRPLVLGLLWGAVSGQWHIVLPVTLFFELFWLDLIPVGIYVPAHAILALLLTLALCSALRFDALQDALLPLLLSLPLAYAGQWLEIWLRKHANTWYDMVASSLHENIQEKCALYSSLFTQRTAFINKALLQYAACHLLLFLVSFVLLYTCLYLFLPFMQHTISTQEARLLLWMSLIGAVLALRTRYAQCTFIAVAGILLLVL